MLRSTRIVMLLALAVQLAGFMRTAIIAAALGASPAVDAYNLGIIAPTYFSMVIGGWLQVGFLGRYAGLVATEKAAAATVYRSHMLLLVFCIAVCVAATCGLYPYQVMSSFVPSHREAMLHAAASALEVCSIILVPIIVGDFIGLILNSHHRFLAAAAAPLANALVSVAALWLSPTKDLHALTWTLVLGCFTQLFVVAVAIFRFRLKFCFRCRGARSEVSSTIYAAIPILPAIMLSNSIFPIVQFRAAALSDGAVAVLSYAQRMNGALTQIAVIGLGTVLLPHFASLWSRGEKGQVVVLLRQLSRVTVLLCAYLSGGIYLMGTETVAFLFNRGAFDIKLTEEVSWIWAILTLSLFSFSLGTFVAKLGQALRSSVAILFSSIISFGATWSVSLWGAVESSLTIVALSLTVAFTATCVFWLAWLSRLVDITGILADIFIGFLRATMAVGLGIFLISFTGGLTATPHPLLGVVLQGALYTLIVGALIGVSGAHRWFFSGRVT